MAKGRHSRVRHRGKGQLPQTAPPIWIRHCTEYFNNDCFRSNAWKLRLIYFGQKKLIEATAT